MTQTKAEPKFSRRSFIKGAAALSATGALVGCAPVADNLSETGGDESQEIPETQIFSGVCRGNCQGGCFLDIHVRDGQVVRTTARDLPDNSYKRICSKGLTHMFRMYGAERIKYPMRRVGERGSGEWERISWDEAIGTIVEKWNTYTEQYGPSSFALYTGSGSYALLSGAQTFGSPFHRFINASGCTFINFYVDMAGIPLGSMIAGPDLFGANNEPTDRINSKVILIWGANPIVSTMHDVHFLVEAQEAGAQLVVIDPQFNNMAQKADLYVPVHSATDALLAIAMIKVMLDKGWVNTEFCTKYTTMPFLVKEDGTFLRTSDLDASIPAEEAKECVIGPDNAAVGWDQVDTCPLNGQIALEDGAVAKTVYELLLDRIAEYDFEECCEKCGIGAAQVEELADLYANHGPAMIYANMGVDHYTNGTGAFAAIKTLIMLAGQIGGPGKGLGYASSVGSIFDMVTMSLVLDPEAPQGPFGWMQFAGGMDVLSMDKVMEEKRYGDAEVDIKGIYCSHINFMVNAADREYMKKWLEKVEFIVMADINMNESARYADMLLPAAHWFEEEDVFNLFSTHPYALFQEKVCDPLFEARTDFDILKDIAKGIGIEKWFDMSGQEYIEMALDNDYAKSCGITYEKLKKEKAMRALPEGNYVFGDNCQFPLGRLTPYLENPQPVGNSGQAFDRDKYRMLYWEPATEVSPDSPLKEKFPFQLMSDHSRFRTHSQWWDVEPLVEIDKEPKIKISPADARALGVEEGDVVKIYNDRGYVVMPVAINAGLPSGIVAAEKGWQDTQFREGHFSSLSGHHSDAFCRNSAFNDVRVAIEVVS